MMVAEYMGLFVFSMSQVEGQADAETQPNRHKKEEPGGPGEAKDHVCASSRLSRPRADCPRSRVHPAAGPSDTQQRVVHFLFCDQEAGSKADHVIP